MGDLITDIAGMSMALRGQATQQAVAVSMLRKSLDGAREQTMGLLDTLLQLPSAVDRQRGVGRNLDVRA